MDITKAGLREVHRGIDIWNIFRTFVCFKSNFRLKGSSVKILLFYVTLYNCCTVSKPGNLHWNITVTYTIDLIYFCFIFHSFVFVDFLCVCLSVCVCVFPVSIQQSRYRTGLWPQKNSLILFLCICTPIPIPSAPSYTTLQFCKLLFLSEQNWTFFIGVTIKLIHFSATSDCYVLSTNYVKDATVCCALKWIAQVVKLKEGHARLLCKLQK